MATNNSINLPNGTTGQLVVGVTGAAGAYASSASADFTFTTATAGATRALTVSNTDNTNTASNAAGVMSVGGTSGGDPYSQYVIGTARSYSWGPDNSDSDILKINTGANATTTPSSGTNLWSMTSAGVRTMPLQPSFLAYLPTQDSNVTGDSTVYTLGSGNALTEVFDQGSNFATNGIFTAPVTGLYCMGFTLQFLGVVGTSYNLSVVATGQTYQLIQLATTIAISGILQSSGQVYIRLTAADTVTFTAAIAGGAKTADIDATLSSTRCWGFLVC